MKLPPTSAKQGEHEIWVLIKDHLSQCFKKVGVENIFIIAHILQFC